MSFGLPATLPDAYELVAGASAPTSDVDTGGYDFTIGGYGFRLATDPNFPYSITTEPVTVHRLDTEAEPSEQSLSALPWIKSQSSFHGGAGQTNLEQGLTTFEYQQEKIDHIRFETCLGVDVWTPGKVSRLPDVRYFNFGFNASEMVASTIGGIDYAVVGGNGGLFQLAWTSGADADPVVTQISLNTASLGGNANCNVTSLATDGVNYYGVVQLAAVASDPNVLTYLIMGRLDTVSPPSVVYSVPNSSAGTTTLKNFMIEPSFEGGTHDTDTKWTTYGTVTSFAQSTTRANYGTHSAKIVIPGPSQAGIKLDLGTYPILISGTFTLRVYVYLPSGEGPPRKVYATSIGTGGERVGTGVTTLDQWVPIEVTFDTAQQQTLYILSDDTLGTSAGTFYIDSMILIQGATVPFWFDGDGTFPTEPKPSWTFSWVLSGSDFYSQADENTVAAQVPGIVGWHKARLVACLGRFLYELDPDSTQLQTLPPPRYTSPISDWSWASSAESPGGILAAGGAGGHWQILEFTLDTSGATPFLSGGASVAQLPPGEVIYTMSSYLGSFLGVGTSLGARIGTFDTYTGNLKMGPISVTTTNPVLAVSGRDRFMYASYTDQQADGKTGLLRIDLSQPVDSAGRLAYAPDLRPPTTAAFTTGAVTSIGVLPMANRIVFLTSHGIHVEGGSPGSDGNAWLRTSRIRYDTAEMKLFKLGRVHGALDQGDLTVIGLAPFGVSTSLGTFRTLPNMDDPGEFRLPSNPNEWIQLEFHLIGSASQLWSYQTKALPAPKPQHIIELTAQCFITENDRSGLDTTDPQDPRTRLQNVRNVEATGAEVRLVEFTNTGSIATLVKIDQIQFRSFKRPSFDDDFGGYITFRLRPTEE